MSTSPESSARTDDRLVTTISRWLTRHISDDELLRELEAALNGELEPPQAEAAEELRLELEVGGERAELEMVARETLEAVALGG
jgi:hypothetical protein